MSKYNPNPKLSAEDKKAVAAYLERLKVEKAESVAKAARHAAEGDKWFIAGIKQCIEDINFYNRYEAEQREAKRAEAALVRANSNLGELREVLKAFYPQVKEGGLYSFAMLGEAREYVVMAGQC